MPKTAKRYRKTAELLEATRAECRTRWLDRFGFEWCDEVAREWSPKIIDPPTEREQKACALAGNLASALRAAMDFCNTAPPSEPKSVAEESLARVLKDLDPEPNPDWLNDPKFDGYVSREDLSSIEALRRIAKPPLPGGRDRIDLIDRGAWFSVPYQIAKRDEGAGEDEVTDAALQVREIAWASILLGNFPDIAKEDLRRGVTVAEAIEQETHAIRGAQRRWRAGIKDGCHSLDVAGDFVPPPDEPPPPPDEKE